MSGTRPSPSSSASYKLDPHPQLEKDIGALELRKPPSRSGPSQASLGLVDPEDAVVVYERPGMSR
jgi:hypothetical protein